MRKIIVFVVMMVCLTACQEAKTSISIQKKLAASGYQLLIGFQKQYDDFYDLKGTCYSRAGEAKTCERIMMPPGNAMEIQWVGKKDSFKIMMDKGEDQIGEIFSIEYTNQFGTYTMDKMKEVEAAVLKDKKSSCTHYFKGNFGNPKLKECPIEREKEYEDMKAAYESALIKLDMRTSEMETFAKDLYENDGTKLKDKIIAMRETQSTVIPEEVNTLLSKDFTSSYTVEGKLYLESSKYKISYQDSVNKTILFELKNSHDYFNLIETDGSSVYSDSNQKCYFDITSDSIANNSSCTSKDMRNAKELQKGFDSLLVNYRITLKELFEYFKYYSM